MAVPMSADQFLAALKAEGVRVRERAGWKTHNRNSRGAWGPLNGVMIHHTGGLNAEDYVWSGDPSLPGPLCHGYINKAGEVVLIGWGRANHAGGGDPDTLAAVINEQYPFPAPNTHDGGAGSVDGNIHFVGYECENKGDGTDPWPAVQIDAMVRATAAVLRFYGWSVNSAIRHMDWSDWKSDPRGINWYDFRAAVAARLAGPAGGNPTQPPKDDMDASEIATAPITYKGPDGQQPPVQSNVQDFLNGFLQANVRIEADLANVQAQLNQLAGAGGVTQAQLDAAAAAGAKAALTLLATKLGTL